MSTFLASALQAALAAGDVLREKFPQAREIKSKGWRDIVTDADFAAQKAILDILTVSFPDHRILSEEGAHDVDLSAPVPTWVIDPLDGTTNYAHRFPSFSVSLALVHQGTLQVGVVHDPLRGETYFAERGQGAFVQTAGAPPQALRVSQVSAIGEALIGLDWARNDAARCATVEALARMAPACRTVRCTGSAALGLAYVAAGNLDGYYHLAFQSWDVAAGVLLILEAGGKITTPAGQTWQLGVGKIAASNGAVHSEFLRVLALA